MEALEHPSPIAALVNALLAPLGIHAPDHLVFSGLIALFVLVLGLIIRSRLSVENPGKLQIVFEDALTAVLNLLEEWIGPKGRNYLPLIATFGIFILFGNYMGLVPGLMAPTSNINVTLGCAITTWVYYHYNGVKEQGVFNYIKHFAMPPGSPVAMAPLMFFIEIISHLSRVLSLSLRLFGNIFGEEMVILILFTLIPFLVPLPMMFLGLITGALQAFIFVLLSIIYLQGAVAVEHHEDEHGHDAPSGHQAPAAA